MQKSIINPRYPYNYIRTCYALKSLCERYNDLILPVQTGKSYQGRKINLIKLGFGNRKILLTAAIHGREYVTTGFLMNCVEYYALLLQQRKSLFGEKIEDVLSEFSFYIVPQSNPDSVEIALSRCRPFEEKKDFCAYTYKDNARGVNLNANFPFEWEAVPKERHPGECEASESETRFLMNICLCHEFEKLISLHTRGGCIYWRDKGNGEVKGDYKLGDKISRLCKLKLCPETKDKSAYSGGFENWFRYKFRKPAVCVELVDDEDAPFDLCCKEFSRYTDWDNTKNLFMAVL